LLLASLFFPRLRSALAVAQGLLRDVFDQPSVSCGIQVSTFYRAANKREDRPGWNLNTIYYVKSKEITYNLSLYRHVGTIIFGRDCD